MSVYINIYIIHIANLLDVQNKTLDVIYSIITLIS